jgi:hypothetical protein
VPLKIWTYDLAREQYASREFLSTLCSSSLDAGYDAIGLYLEHRFAYPSAPWAHGKGALTPDDVAWMRREFPEIRLIPFVNLLGHMEGFLYTERGKRFAEERFKGLQACPSNPEFVRFANELLDDVLAAFDDEIVHIGGDETAQLGTCPACASHSKPDLYVKHFAPMCERVTKAGRRPAIWGDMLLEHLASSDSQAAAAALRAIPRETLVFDWQYFQSPTTSTEQLRSLGFDVFCCPTLHTYNSTWLNLQQAVENIQGAQDAAGFLDEGFCLTTWECGLMGNYATLLPAIRWAAQSTRGALLEAFGPALDWARLMGVDLVNLGGPFSAGKTRSSLKCRLLLYGNPFLAWQHHHEDLAGPLGDRALEIARHAIQVAPDSDFRGVAVFLEKAIEFVRLADEARQAYAQGLPGVAVASLAPTRQIFDELEKVARATHLNAGGSLADIERCRNAKTHVEVVIRRIRDHGDGSLGYLPSFESITNPQFCAHDQGSWWRINAWGSD